MRPLLAATAILFASLLSLAAQGPLTPPGAPAPTMKTLDQIHDRIAAAEEVLERRIPIASLPITIIRPGSYYLTGSVTFAATSGHAITVTVSDVTIDLMGHTLASTAGVTGNAIQINGALRNITVKNGTIAGTNTVSITPQIQGRLWTSSPGGFALGVSGPSTKGCHFRELRISGCRSTGLLAGDGAIVDRVTSVHNGGKGIDCDAGTVSNSAVALNRGQGILASAGTVTASSAVENEEDGIAAHAIINSSATRNGESGLAGNVVTNSSAVDNEQGIIATEGTVTNCNARSNRFDGIRATNGVVAFCRARYNGTNINATGAVLTGNNTTP